MFQRTALLLVLAGLSLASAAPEADRITNLPGYTGPSLTQYAGYVTVDQAHNRSIFYWYIESLSPKADSLPLVVWFQGGPGCSGLAGLMSENGPFRAKADGTLDFFDESWLRYANVLWIEQPAGVGFSFSDDPRDYYTNDTQAAKDSHAAIKGFIGKFPEFRSRDLWLTGESYGGIYVPTTAAEIIADPELNPQLKGLMLGNPVIGCDTPPGIQINLFYWHGLVGYSNYYSWLQAGCNTNNPQEACRAIENTIYKELGVVDQQLGVSKDKNFPSIDPDNLYIDFCTGNGTLESAQSLRGMCDPYGDNYVKYFNMPAVQAAIHAVPTTWSVCSYKINYNSNAGSMVPYLEKFFKEKPNMRILYYSGDVDIATVPFADTQACLFTLSATKDRKSDWGPWFVRGHTAGYAETFGQYTYATVKGAGHEAPKFQPIFNSALFKRFLYNEDIREGSGEQQQPVVYTKTVGQGQRLRSMGIRP